mgnify:CR=1 FL=1
MGRWRTRLSRKAKTRPPPFVRHENMKEKHRKQKLATTGRITFYPPVKFRGKCRDCGTRTILKMKELMRAASPRCLVCGGIVDKGERIFGVPKRKHCASMTQL